MAFRAGTTSYLAIGTATGALVNISSYVDDVSYPQTAQTLEVSAFGTSAKAFIAGLTDGDVITFKGPYDPTVWTYLTGIKAAQAGGTAGFPFLWGPGGSVTAQAKAAGSCYITGITTSAGVGGRVDYNASVQVTGAVTNSVF